MNRDQLEAAIAPENRDTVVVVRKAAKPHTCVGQREFASYVIHIEHPEPGLLLGPGAYITHQEAHRWTPEGAEEAADDYYRRRYPAAEVTIEPKPNRNYRPDCLGEIPVGDLYLEYIGDVGFAQTGRPYCERCGVAVWGVKS